MSIRTLVKTRSWMTVFAFVPLLSVLAAPVPAAATSPWTVQKTNLPYTLYSVSCPSESVCLAVGSGGLMLRTTDGGATWVTLSPGVRDPFLSISCPSVTTCFTADNFGVIMRTTDQGQTWTSQMPGGQYFSLYAISCASTSVCLTANGFRTFDGGNTWVSQSGYAQAISCPTTALCVAGTYSGAVTRSTDSGGTWTTEYASPHAVDAVDCADSSVCVALGGDAFGYTSLTSADGGATWTRAIAAGTIYSADCPTETFCVGAAGTSQIFTTTDGLSSYQWQDPGTPGQYYYGVDCPSVSTCFAVGTSIVRYSSPPLSIAGSSLAGFVESAGSNQTVASFDGGVGPYATSINWGDGQTSSGAVSGTGPYTVAGSHTYTEEGSYSITIMVTDSAGSTVSTSDTALVSDASLAVSASAVSVSEGGTFNGVVATFSDGDTAATASNYSATIVWGDGSSSTGTIGATGAGSFTVSSSHAYAEEGSYSLSVTVTDVASYQATEQISVADGALQALPDEETIQTKKKTEFVADVASFTDSDPAGTTKDYRASISWGDGSSSAGFVLQDGSQFLVFGSHTYQARGTFTVTVQIADAGGSAASSVTDTAQVS